MRAAAPPEQSRGVSLAGDSGQASAGDAKAALYRALDGVDRGIFGMTSAQRSEIHGLVELLEARNPTPEPTAALQDKVDGCWKLIYSTISILGKKRTKLGLRDFISLGDFLQIIDVKEVSESYLWWNYVMPMFVSLCVVSVTCYSVLFLLISCGLPLDQLKLLNSLHPLNI